MSDMAESFHNAWVVEMKHPRHRLYCTWHVDRAWRKNLCKIKSKPKQLEMYKVLRTLLQEHDTDAFGKMFEKAVNRMSSDNETKEFINYCIGNYANCVLSWVYCHRIDSGININMHIERMHSILKYIYLQGKKVKRHALIRFIRDRAIDRFIILHKGKICSKIKELRKWHKTCLKMSHEMVMEDDFNSSWHVMSESVNEFYVIKKLEKTCKCQITCIHHYSCSCIDSSIKLNMCKHIHLICQFLKNRNYIVSNEVKNHLKVLMLAKKMKHLLLYHN